MKKHGLGYILGIAASVIIITGLYYFYSWFYLWSPTPEWDKSPQKRVFTIGEMWTEVDYNYIPDVQIWGDGYMVWVEHLADGNRKVFEGYLSQQEMTSLVQKLIGLDFFKRNRKSKDYAGTFITVSLIGASRSEWLDPDNKQLYDFAIYLQRGAGTNGKELIPTMGTFFAIPIEKTWLPATTKATYHWSDDKFGYSLDTLIDKSDGKEISGEELKFAWEVVNSPLSTIESKGKVYWVAVVLPKVSR